MDRAFASGSYWTKQKAAAGRPRRGSGPLAALTACTLLILAALLSARALRTSLSTTDAFGASVMTGAL